MEKKKMTFPQIFFTILFAAMGILFLLYGIMVMLVNSGSKFFVVWFGLTAVSLILSAASFFRFFSKIPVPVRIICLVVLVLCFGFFCFIEGRILNHFNDTPPANMDYIIILGAQMRESGPSLVLKYRLDSAIEYLSDNPGTICIVSGGQGSNESAPEAIGMKKYMTDHGIDGERILTEEKSKNTIENITLSKKIISAAGSDKNSSSEESETSLDDSLNIGVVTNNFHLYRALSLAKKQGLSTTYGLSAPSTFHFLPNNMLREFIGVMKDTLLGNMSL
jgi:uncharacterized SAM-binding protein YcdF (DUF218 family)